MACMTTNPTSDMTMLNSDGYSKGQVVQSIRRTQGSIMASRQLKPKGAKLIVQFRMTCPDEPQQHTRKTSPAYGQLADLGGCHVALAALCQLLLQVHLNFGRCQAEPGQQRLLPSVIQAQLLVNAACHQPGPGQQSLLNFAMQAAPGSVAGAAQAVAPALPPAVCSWLQQLLLWPAHLAGVLPAEHTEELSLRE